MEAVAASSTVPGPKNLSIARLGSGEIRLGWNISDQSLLTVIERQIDPNVGFAQIAKTNQGATEHSIPFDSTIFTSSFRMRVCNLVNCSPHTDSLYYGTRQSPTGESEQLLKLPIDLADTSFVEGLGRDKTFSTSGKVDLKYEGDRISAELEPNSKERLLVINEMYHPRWKAFSNGVELNVYPVNTVMRGVIVPPGVSHVSMAFVPFLWSKNALMIMLLGAGLICMTCFILYRSQATNSH